MQFSTLIVALFASASAVMAQDLSGLPACAVTCFADNFVNSSCAITDVACLCADQTFFGDVEVCVILGCSSDDAGTTLIWSTEQCAAVGVNLKRDLTSSIFGRKH